MLVYHLILIIHWNTGLNRYDVYMTLAKGGQRDNSNISCCITTSSLKMLKVIVTRVGNHFRSSGSAIRRNLSYTTSKHVLPLYYFTEEESAIRDSVQRLAKEKCLPLVRVMEEKGEIDREIIASLFANGLMGIEISDQYQGTGASLMSTILTIEEMSKIDPSVAILIAIHNALVCNMIKKLGNDAQKETYLPHLTQEKIGCFCLSEPSSGSDAFSMKTTARIEGNDFIINGTKMWISNANLADVFIVFANADPSKGYRGITAFILDKSLPGLSVGPPEKKLGLKASNTCPVNFDNVRVPQSAVLGEKFKGYQYAAGYLNESRIGVAAQMLGIAEGCFELTIPYTLERKQFGQSIYDFQGMQHQIAEIATQLECAKLLVYNATRLFEAGLPITKESSMAKYYASELAQNVTRKCIDWLGGVGFTTSFLQEKFYRDCKVGTIYEGTSNMQLSTIAKSIKKEYNTE